jgi:hypothetical protein
MKMIQRTIVLAVLLAGLGAGCVASNLTELEKAHATVIQALGNDPATVCVVASYGPATIMGGRTNITNGDVKCNAQGLELKSQATQVGVPLTIVPSVTVGPPTMTK